jgi:hypothetical protein
MLSVGISIQDRQTDSTFYWLVVVNNGENLPVVDIG